MSERQRKNKDYTNVNSKNLIIIILFSYKSYILILLQFKPEIFWYNKETKDALKFAVNPSFKSICCQKIPLQ